MHRKRRKIPSLKPNLLEPAVEHQDTKRKRALEDDAEKHRNSARKHQKKMPVRIMECENSRESGKLCANGWPCDQCNRDGRNCFRTWCRWKEPGKCKDKSCNLAHEKDIVAGVVNSKMATKLRQLHANPVM